MFDRIHWLTDPRVRACDLITRAVLCDLLCLSADKDTPIVWTDETIHAAVGGRGEFGDIEEATKDLIRIGLLANDEDGYRLTLPK